LVPTVTILKDTGQTIAWIDSLNLKEIANKKLYRSTTELVSEVRSGSILLQKSFWGDERKFSGTLTRVARGDVRDHVVPRKNDHGPAERRDGASQCYSSLKITFREIFGSLDFRLLQQNRSSADVDAL
jgi:hypothetical protein